MCQPEYTTVAAPGPYPSSKPHTTLNPFVPNASIVRFPNGIFELQLYLPGVVSQVELVPYDNYVLARGTLAPRVRTNAEGHVSALLWTDQASGEFTRDLPICLSPGTEFVVLERRHESDNYIVRYTIRNSVATGKGHCSNNLGSSYATATATAPAPATATNIHTTQGHGHVHGHGLGYASGVTHGVHGTFTNLLNTPRGAYGTCTYVPYY